MSGDARITVLIAAFNAADFLERGVRSALAQTLRPVEILIVDDASTDGTLNVAQRLAHDHAEVCVIALPQNGGPSIARNAGLAAAMGEWVAVLDADDAYEPDHLATLASAVSEHGADAVLANFLYFDPMADRAGAPGIAANGSAFIVDAAGYVDHARPFRSDSDWGLLKPMFRTAFLRKRKIGYPGDSRHGEDFLLMCEVLLSGGRVVVSPRASYRYTHRGIGWSRTRIDYASTIGDSRRLLADTRVQADPAIGQALDRRIEAISRWSAQQLVGWLTGHRQYLRLARRAATDSDVRREIWRRLATGAHAWLRDRRGAGDQARVL